MFQTNLFYCIKNFFALVCLYIFLISSAGAGSFQVAPTKVYLTEKKPVKTIHVRNLSSEPLIVSGYFLSWTQNEEKSTYKLSNDLLITPPIITIAPKSSQIIRIGTLDKNPLDIEKAYRLYLEEVIPEELLKQHAFNMALRIGMPVFVTPDNEVKNNDLIWDLKKTAQGIRISVTNPGNKHKVIKKLKFLDKKGQHILAKDELAEYVLAGATRHFDLSNADLIKNKVDVNNPVAVIAKLQSGKEKEVLSRLT